MCEGGGEGGGGIVVMCIIALSMTGLGMRGAHSAVPPPPVVLQPCAHCAPPLPPRAIPAPSPLGIHLPSPLVLPPSYTVLGLRP